MGDRKPKEGWLARRREQKRLKRERTGDSPQRTAEEQMLLRSARKPQDTAVTDVVPLGRGARP
jgi:hypothetical protein